MNKNQQKTSNVMTDSKAQEVEALDKMIEAYQMAVSDVAYEIADKRERRLYWRY